MGTVEYGHYVEVPVANDSKTVSVREGGRMHQVFVLRENGQELPFNHIIAEAGASAQVCIIVLPGVSADISMSVDFMGPEADIRLSGLFLGGSDEKVNIRTEMRHRVEKCVSNQVFNCIAGGRARIGFDGKIVIAPDAQKIEAYQSNRNMLLSENARIDTRPQLEIYADDVKCSHGATVGTLNEEEQFYMQSRGIPRNEARILQVISFASEVLEHVPEGEMRMKVAEELEREIRNIMG